MAITTFFSKPIRYFMAIAIACCLFGLTGCTTSGRTFQSSALWQVVPGQTTVGQASEVLGSEPVNIYRRLDGSMVARWAHSASLVTDAVYFRQELWLAFDSDGKFQRVVKKINIPLGVHPGVVPQATTSGPAKVWTQPLTDAAATYPLEN